MAFLTPHYHLLPSKSINFSQFSSTVIKRIDKYFGMYKIERKPVHLLRDARAFRAFYILSVERARVVWVVQSGVSNSITFQSNKTDMYLMSNYQLNFPGKLYKFLRNVTIDFTGIAGNNVLMNDIYFARYYFNVLIEI
jgi:hypothetical protein